MVNRVGGECEPLNRSATAGHGCLLLEWDALRYVGMRCGPIPGTRARTPDLPGRDNGPGSA